MVPTIKAPTYISRQVFVSWPSPLPTPCFGGDDDEDSSSSSSSSSSSDGMSLSSTPDNELLLNPGECGIFGL